MVRPTLAAVYAPSGSYAYNALGRRGWMPGPSRSISSGLGFGIYDGQALSEPIRESDAKVPADLYAFGDAPLATAPWGPEGTFRLGGAADYNRFVAENTTSENAQHSSGFNMLLADMHTENVKPDILLGANPAWKRRWNHDNLP